MMGGECGTYFHSHDVTSSSIQISVHPISKQLLSPSPAGTQWVAWQQVLSWHGSTGKETGGPSESRWLHSPSAGSPAKKP